MLYKSHLQKEFFMALFSWRALKDFLHAQLCYQYFITPLPLPLEKAHRGFARIACEFLSFNRTNIIHGSTPRHYVIHHFAAKPNARKILITHGWMSRAAYMARLIWKLQQAGYEIYALDFPAHGEARGFQVTWLESAAVLRQILNEFGPFYGVIGHSYGGAMLLNTFHLAQQLPAWRLDCIPQKAVFLAAPMTLKTPISGVARYFKLNGRAFSRFKCAVKKHSQAHLKYLNSRQFMQASDMPILCVHGEDDTTILPDESKHFCRHYPHASLTLLPKVNHVSILIDERIEKIVHDFLH